MVSKIRAYYPTEYKNYRVTTDQLNMTVFIKYLVKRDLSSVCYCTMYMCSVYTGQATFLPVKHGHV